MQVVITGGLGFIGSNIARKIHPQAESVKIIDAKLEKFGANLFNISDFSESLSVVEADVRNRSSIEDHIADADIVFHCAAQLSRTISMEDPTLDADINCSGTLNVLSIAAEQENPPRVIFTSSQAVVGKPNSLPIDEHTPPDPIDIYGANKAAGEYYCDVYHRVKDVPTTVLRLSNVYGERAQMKNPNYGVINRFFKQSLQDDIITVFKPGEMTRDFIHVSDVVDVLIKAAQSKKTIGEKYMIATGEETTIFSLAQKIVKITGKGTIELVEWPDSWDAIRVGDLSADPSKLRNDLNWNPSIDLEDGIQRTTDYYANNFDKYGLDI